MTPLERAFHVAVTDGGALGAAALDRATRAVLASAGQLALPEPAALALLLGDTRPGSPLTRACGGPPVNTARELFVAGHERALFISLLRTGEIIVVSTPPTMSVAVGWTLVRTLMTALETDPP